jgi:hypothetical protein
MRTRTCAEVRLLRGWRLGQIPTDQWCGSTVRSPTRGLAPFPFYVSHLTV